MYPHRAALQELVKTRKAGGDLWVFSNDCKVTKTINLALLPNK